MDNQTINLHSNELRASHLIPVGPERLREPELSYFLALRTQFHAAQVQASTLGQALQVFVGAISRALGLDETVTIDADGFLHHAPPAEVPAQENERR